MATHACLDILYATYVTLKELIMNAMKGYAWRESILCPLDRATALLVGDTGLIQAFPHEETLPEGVGAYVVLPTVVPVITWV